MSDLVGNLEDQFFRDAAHIYESHETSNMNRGILVRNCSGNVAHSSSISCQNSFLECCEKS